MPQQKIHMIKQIYINSKILLQIFNLMNKKLFVAWDTKHQFWNIVFQLANYIYFLV